MNVFPNIIEKGIIMDKNIQYFSIGKVILYWVIYLISIAHDFFGKWMVPRGQSPLARS